MLLDEYVGDLKDLQNIDFQEYKENKILRRAVERTLHLAVEACLDIGQHIIAQEGYRTPKDNRDTFHVLTEENIISDSLLKKVNKMAGFRNLIVNDYAQIDNQAVFDILQKHLQDFDAFARAVLVYIDSD